MTDEAKVTCGNRECRVSENGKCVEGLELSACPHFGKELEVDPATSDSETTPGLLLPSADMLSSADAADLVRSRIARVTAIVGPKGSGKTSLIASLYDLFQEGAVAGVEFARSETLHAFELACHDARSASRRGVPEMERTGFGEAKFYHIDISGAFAGPGLALLLADRAGEEYRTATDDAGGVTQFPEVSRADTPTVLVDGQRLSDTGARHNLRSEVIMILQALKDGGSLREGRRLLVVLTKMDIIAGLTDRPRAEADFASLLATIREHFADQFASIESCTVCASPKSDVLSRGTGLAAMLKHWARAPALPQTAKVTVAPSARAFSRFVARQSSERANG